jgi:hypothetical protein
MIYINDLKPVDVTEIIHDIIYPHFGILIPNNNGMLWRHQVDGCSCHQVFVRGVFIPLRRPRKFLFMPDYTYYWCNNNEESYKDYKNYRLSMSLELLNVLQGVNYNYEDDKLIWNCINETLPFVYEDVEYIREGIKSIRITGVPLSSDDKEFGYTEPEIDREWMDDLRSLIGKEVYLIYPNSD